MRLDQAASDAESAIVHLVGCGVRPIVATAPRPRDVKRVLIGYSGSADSAKTMKRSVQLGLYPDAILRIAHVEGEVAGAKELLRDAAAYCREWGVEAETTMLSGSPATALLREAEAYDADLLVVGDSARGLLKRKAFGDVTLIALRDGGRPVFLSH